jgi:hypothetical protein
MDKAVNIKHSKDFLHPPTGPDPDIEEGSLEEWILN